MNFQKGLISLFLLTLCSCAGMGQKIDADRAKAVRKVAIVAIEVHQVRPTDNLGFSKLHELSDGPESESKEMQAMAKNLSIKFANKLEAKTKWKVIKMEDLVNNSEYKKKVAALMSGPRSVLMTSSNTEVIYPKNTLDVLAFRKMSIEEKKQLAKSLGVDALAEVLLANNIDQSMYSLGHITGDAAFTYTGRANLQVYDLNSDDPVWRSQNIDGMETPSSDTLAKNMSKLEKLSRLGEEASTSAISKLMETYPL